MAAPSNPLRTRLMSLLRWLGFALVWILTPSTSQNYAPLMVYDFDLGPIPEDNVEQVRSLGFVGLVTRCAVASDVPKLSKYARYVEGLDDFQMLAYVNYSFQNPDSPTVWRDILPTLQRIEAPLWVIIQQASVASDVRDLLMDMADTADSFGVPVVIYPHWDTDIEDAEEAQSLIASIGHPNLYTSLHTCHEIRAGRQGRLPEVVAKHAPATRLVTIAGADVNAYQGPPPAPWDDAIKPLDRGAFDLTPFLRALETYDYSGPIVLHTWGLGNDPGHLDRSMRRYIQYRRGL